MCSGEFLLLYSESTTQLLSWLDNTSVVRNTLIRNWAQHCWLSRQNALWKQLLLTVYLKCFWSYEIRHVYHYSVLVELNWIDILPWQAIFERYDKDRSGKIDLFELRDALYGIGYAVPASVLQILISKYDNGSGGRVELNFDCFVEYGF